MTTSQPTNRSRERSAWRANLSKGLTLSCGVAVLGAAAEARADVASWMFVGAGASEVQQAGGFEDRYGVMQLDAGFGSSPMHALVFGGLLRTLTHFEGGTDLALLQRTTTGGFSRGNWGLALDLGAYQRYWGPDSTGFMGTLSLGAPWGVQLAATGAFGSAEGQMISLTLGIDWARLTAHRESGSWWPNYVLPLSRERH